MDLLAKHLCVSATLCLPSFLHVSAGLWSPVIRCCFVLIQRHEQTALQLLEMMIDGVCWITVRRRREPWRGVFADITADAELSLPRLSLLRTGTRVRLHKIRCEKHYLIPSSGSFWGFHTFPSGYSGNHCYGNWVLLTRWPNGWWGFTTSNSFCIFPDLTWKNT